jgi:hypothetical protein
MVRCNDASAIIILFSIIVFLLISCLICLQGVELQDVEWFQSTIDQYSNSSDHEKILKNVITEINKLSLDDRNKILTQLDFEPMFSVLIKWNK